jgi:hypothetical protein
MRPLILLFVNIALTLAVASCSSTKTVYQGLTAVPASLNYINDSNVISLTSTDTITIQQPIITDKKFSQNAELKKQKVLVIPAIIFNYWSFIYEYWIGSSNIQNDVSQFVQKSLINEATRSGKFVPTSMAESNKGLQLEITIDTLEAGGDYEKYGMFTSIIFYYFLHTAEESGPGGAYSNLHYKLKRGDEILLEGNANSSKPVENLIETKRSKQEIRFHYTASLVEALASTFNSNIKTIVNEVGIFLSKEKTQTFKKEGPQ